MLLFSIMTQFSRICSQGLVDWGPRGPTILTNQMEQKLTAQTEMLNAIKYKLHKMNLSNMHVCNVQ